VALLRTDVSEERSASTIRVTKIGELGTLAVTNYRCTLVILKMEALLSSETSVFTRTTGRNISEGGILHSHRREHHKFYILMDAFNLIGVSRCISIPNNRNVFRLRSK
jgi:hypothetical protein